jgi:hypothetical protein
MSLNASSRFRKALLLLDHVSNERGQEELRRTILAAEEEGDELTLLGAKCCLGELLCRLGLMTEAIPLLREVAAMHRDDDLLDYEKRQAQRLLEELRGSNRKDNA